MSGHRWAADGHIAELVMRDPASGNIVIDRMLAHVPLVSATAETRTLKPPTKSGIFVTLYHRTDGGDITVSTATAFNEFGDTSFVFSDPGQFAVFESCYDGTTYFWRMVSHHNLGNLMGLLATVTEINRTADASTRPVAAGANLTVTQDLHDGKTILLDQATGTAVTLPAMTGSGSRYRFAVTVAKSGGSDVITATGAHLFGGVTMNTDTTAGNLFTCVAAANAGGSTTITLNGGTKGGRKGDWIEIEDLATNIGIVRGMLNGSGTEDTPFA